MRTSEEMSAMSPAHETLAQSATAWHSMVSRAFCGLTSPYPTVESTVIVK